MKYYIVIYLTLISFNSFAGPIVTGTFLLDHEGESFANDRHGWSRQQSIEPHKDRDLVNWTLFKEDVTDAIYVEMRAQTIEKNFISSINTSLDGEFKPIDIKTITLKDYVHTYKAKMLTAKNCELNSKSSYQSNSIGLEFIYPHAIGGYKGFTLQGLDKNPLLTSYRFKNYSISNTTGFGIGSMFTYNFKVQDESILHKVFKAACGVRQKTFLDPISLSMQDAIDLRTQEAIKVYLGEIHPRHEDASYIDVYGDFLATAALAPAQVVQKWILPNSGERSWVRQTWIGKFTGSNCHPNEDTLCDVDTRKSIKHHCVFAMEKAYKWKVIGAHCIKEDKSYDLNQALPWPN